jgi:TolB-like protein/tetratricopeptide (TPR) repeat protein/predicted Ser/Thr protein kinase
LALTNEQLARLSELLDTSLSLPPMQRRAWLDSLPEKDRPLVQALRESLLADDPDSATGGDLERMPRIEGTGAPEGGTIDRHAGERLGAYELLRPLGAGGMAEVWLANRADGAFERQVALKIPHLRGMPTEMAERFARECRILATLETPNIARLYDAGVDATGAPYIAMEYVQGEPLVAWCDARGLETPARIRLFIQVLDTVSHAHRRQILHRDLKPSNILVTEQGEVRLLDFGVARLLQGDADGSLLTHAWGHALTPAYASPELLRGEQVDLRSDIYSLGVLLHELLTGGRPGRQPSESTDKWQGRALSSGLREVLAKAVAQDPADRYADAASFAEALRPFAGADTARVRIGRFGTRPLLVAGLAALALVVAEAVALLRPRTEPAAVQTVAVLPFTNLTGDAGQDIVADGLAEEVANQLAAIRDLRVTGRASSFSFKGRNEDLRVIAKKLGVANLLEGSPRGDGTKLRVTVQLIDGRDGARRWSSRPYDHEQSGILAAQDEIAQDVARALSVTLDVGEMNRAQGGTRNLEAARRYWQWRELMLAERWDTQHQKVRLLRDAVRLDPQFVVAWDALADSLRTLALFIGDAQPEQAEQLRAEAEQAWGRVAELAPDSWVALRKLSDDLLRAEKWAESEAVARQLLESGPFTFEKAQPLTNVLFSTGRIDEAIELQAQVMILEPQAMFVSRDQQWNLYAAGRFEETEAEYQRSQTLDGSHDEPDFVALLRGLARQDGDPQALRELFQGVWSEDDPQWLHDFSAAIPDRQGMLAVLRKAVEAGEDGAPDIAPKMADALGDRDLALTGLRSHVTRIRGRTGTWWQPWLLPHSGARADPRFKELMREAGVADYWRQSGKWPDFCRPVGEDDFECH